MTGTAERSSSKLWDAVKAEIILGSKGGKPGQWSARKAPLALTAYNKRGSYKGAKSDDDHLVQ